MSAIKEGLRHACHARVPRSPADLGAAPAVPRWPFLGLAVVLFAVSAYTLSGYAFGMGIPPGWGLPPAVMIAVPLALAWNRPVIAWFLSALSLVPVFLVDEALVEHGPTLGSGLATVPWFMQLILLLAQMPVVFLVALAASRAVSLLAGSITLVAGALVAVPRLAVDEIAMLQGMSTWTMATFLAILLGRVRLRLHQATGRLAAEQSRMHVLEERARIARELHDVVSHHMSVIAVQASTAPYRFRLDRSPELGREFRTIGDSPGPRCRRCARWSKSYAARPIPPPVRPSCCG